MGMEVCSKWKLRLNNSNNKNKNTIISKIVVKIIVVLEGLMITIINLGLILETTTILIIICITQEIIIRRFLLCIEIRMKEEVVLLIALIIRLIMQL